MKIIWNTLLVLLLLSAISKAQTLKALISSPDMFDGKVVIVQGELIGDIFSGRDGFWVNILDSGTAIGLWVPESEKNKIKFLGRYGIEGDYVKITGIFHKQCVQHAGDMDIHVSCFEIIKRGSYKKEQLPLEKIIFAFSLGIVSLAAIGILHLLSHKGSPPHNQ
ncbi:MAG: DNA-binding protein [Candidatus Omnitrophica bacterium]|nr:DNA-binding protein [Candidatus Omnitrophota bacterium]